MFDKLLDLLDRERGRQRNARRSHERGGLMDRLGGALAGEHDDDHNRRARAERDSARRGASDDDDDYRATRRRDDDDDDDDDDRERAHRRDRAHSFRDD